jgi:hypothetical protein
MTQCAFLCRYWTKFCWLSSHYMFPLHRPWHVFVDTAPESDTDFEVAATFDEEPGLEEINMAIVECLEGSEREDEIVAQQMQQALEEGQLDRVSDMIGEVLDFDDVEDASDNEDEQNDADFDMFEEDSV